MAEFHEEEDEIQALYQTAPQLFDDPSSPHTTGSGSPVTCGFCNESLNHLTHEERGTHYEVHFSEGEDTVASEITSGDTQADSSSPKKSNGNGSGQHIRHFGTKKDVFWIPAHGTTPPDNFTPGLTAVLKRALIKSHAKGQTQRAAVCRDGICHIGTQFWDVRWGCGYRNFLMSCTALMEQPIQPLYISLLNKGSPPGVRNLQEWIEDAWRDGYDEVGKTYFKGKLVGSSKWIGTGELYTAFTYRGIPCNIVDFPKSARGPNAVTDWVKNYFLPPSTRPPQSKASAFDALSGATAVTQTDLMPLILQHQGHSRTIIGIEMNKTSQPNLLILDPGKKPSSDIRKAALSRFTFTTPSAGASKNSSPGLLSRFLPSHRKRNREEVFGGDDGDSDVEIVESSGPVSKKARCVGDGEVRQGLANKNINNGSPVGKEKGKALDGGRTVPQSPAWSASPAKRIADELDAGDVLKYFRVSLSQLSKNDQYQILWFPLESPLSDREKQRRKVVLGDRAA